MAKIDNKRLADVLPLMGNTYQIKNFRGKLYAASWPKKRGKNLPPLTQLRNRWFKIATELASFVPGSQIAMSHRYSPKGPLYPRDYLLSAMAGRLYQINTDDGKQIWSMAELNELSKELDIFGQQQGMMLAREGQLWRAFGPMAIGEVPSIDPDTGNIVGMLPNGNRGGHMLTTIEPNVVVTSASATMGWFCTLRTDIRVDYALVHYDAILNATYKCQISRLTGTTVSEVVAETPVFTGPANALRRNRLNFSSTPLLEKDNKYLFSFTRTDSTTTTSPKPYNSLQKGGIGFPHAEDLGFARYNSTGLTGSETPANSGLTFPFTIDLAYRF